MYCQRHRFLNYRFISIMFWAFPYLLWQAFGDISGFVVGVVLAAILTGMFRALFRRDEGNTTTYSGQQALHMAEFSVSHQAMSEQPAQEVPYRPYRSGYQAEVGLYREKQTLYQGEQFQSQYEEMQVPYPQELPPIEQQ